LPQILYNSFGACALIGFKATPDQRTFQEFTNIDYTATITETSLTFVPVKPVKITSFSFEKKL